MRTGELLDRAAREIDAADALLITAGAGMGVDSGLPDFRGTEGFWRAYPPMRRLGISFVAMANPGWFERDPALAWGFYGHRLNLYRDTEPHAGFSILLEISRSKEAFFVFTSNVDGQFQKAGFDEEAIIECHGSIHHLQCSGPCSDQVWPGEDLVIEVDPERFRASPPLPTCPSCGGIARPNILMFGDWKWIPDRTSAQEERLDAFMGAAGGGRTAVVEIGAGRAVPTVRSFSGRAAGLLGTLIRINPDDPETDEGIGIPMGGLEALSGIAERLGIEVAGREGRAGLGD